MRKIEQQLKHNDCGISAVKIIYNLFNIHISRNYIEENIYLTAEGSSLADIQDFFTKHSFTASFNLLDLNSLKFRADKIISLLPCILPVKNKAGQHYVVITGVRKNRLQIVDPGKGSTYTWSITELMNNAHIATANYDYLSSSTILQQAIDQEVASYNIPPDDVAEFDKADLLNKLTYFGYVKENFGFAGEEAEKNFLKDLLFNQQIDILPKQFRSLKLSGAKLRISAPVVLTIKRPEVVALPATGSPQVAEASTTSYKRLFKELRPYHKLWGIYIASALFAALIAQIGIFSSQILIDNILPSYNLHLLVLFAIGFGIFRVFALILTLYKSLIAIHLANIFDNFFLSSFIEKLNSFSIRYIHTFSRGDLTERVKDSLQLKTFFIRFFTSILIDAFVSLYSLFVLFIINWKIALIVVVILVIFVVWFLLVTPYIQENEKRRFLEKSAMFSSIFENIDGLQVIKSFRLEALLMQKISPKIKGILDVQRKVKYVSLVNSAVINFIMIIASILILVFLSQNAITARSISVGQIITFLALSGQVFSSVSSILDENLDLQENSIILQRYFDFNEPGKPEATHTDSHNLIKSFDLNLVEFKNVSFHYIPQKPVFTALNVLIERGEKIRLEGNNGAGKSTFCKVLSLLYTPDSGDILINNEKYTYYQKAQIRKKILLVSNEDILFNESLGYNINFNYQTNVSEILSLARKIGLYNFIAEKPEGLDYVIYEQGRNLSTGQRKKILLMRALLSPAELIILDEALSGIDKESKEKIEQYINNITDRSFIVISHEPLVHIQFSKTLIMQNGRIEQLQLQAV